MTPQNKHDTKATLNVLKLQSVMQICVLC